MNPILLNFVHIIRRFKMATTLNILGLSVAFAAFMIIMIQLDYDFGFDKFHKDSDKIFRVELAWGNEGAQAVISRPLAENFFESSPHILAGAITNPWGRDLFFHVEKDGAQNFFRESAIGVSPDFLDVFTFDFVEGVENALRIPDNVIIPQSMARKLFGVESAVGQQLIRSDGSQTVGAVYRDFPDNSVVNNYIYGAIPEEENKDVWGNNNYHVYIRVNDAYNTPLLWENFKRNFDLNAVISAGYGFDVNLDEWGMWLRLTLLPDIHFTTDVQWDNTPKASRQTLMVLFAIAIVIIVIAAINYTNFSAALTPTRIKSINTQRVVGAHQSTMRLMLVFEAVGISILAYFGALCLILLFQDTPLVNLVDADLSFTAYPLIFGGTALIALFTGFLAGVYPSRYMTSFEPALVLKGSFGLTPKGKQLRNTLIGIQFIASFALIIGASFMFLQNHFMQNSPLGYDRDNLIVVDIGRIQTNRDAFTNQIRTYSGVEDITFAERILSSSDQYMGWGRPYKDGQISFQIIPVHYTFLEVMGIEITEGRGFRREDTDMETGVFIFNETARRNFNMELNTSIEGGLGGEIIGFMPDVKFASFRSEMVPMAFFVIDESAFWHYNNIAYIKLHEEANVKAALSHINATLAQLSPEFHSFIEVRFFDEVLQSLYEKETAISSLITLFSLMAIFISIVGVFGLVVFDSQYRRKEIGVRKVFGATTLSIIVMFNKGYFKILVICFVIAAPMTWYAVNRWLENFAYKTPMYWWVYLLAFVAVGVITIFTVTFQNWRAASEDPVKTIMN